MQTHHMNEYAIKSLLRQVLGVKLKYDEIAQLTGERFNIFRILEVTTDEVRMHSKLLGELLNPKGSHGCGDIFLRLFIQSIKCNSDIYHDRLVEFNHSTAKVKIEYSIPGYISENKLEGGRIDILIESGAAKIIIENKIYAGDQNNQLIRYYNFDNNAPIYYLTLDGKIPTDLSCKDDKSGIHLKQHEHYECISYKETIVNWLKECLKETVSLPLLRESVQQYIHLINLLTNQSSYEEMNDNITNIILENDEHIEGMFLITQAKKNALGKRSEFLSGLITEEIKSRSLKCQISPWHHKFPRLEYYPDGWKDHLIGFTEENGFVCGLKRRKDSVKPLQFEDVKHYIGKNWKTSNWWLSYKSMNDGHLNLFTPEPWLKRNEYEVVKSVVDQIESLIDQTDKLPAEKRQLL